MARPRAAWPLTTSTEWAEREIELSRQFVAGAIERNDYCCEFMAAHNAGALAGEVVGLERELLLNDLLYAVCSESGHPDRESWQLDEQQLRARLVQHLRDWDDGDYPAASWER